MSKQLTMAAAGGGSWGLFASTESSLISGREWKM